MKQRIKEFLNSKGIAVKSLFYNPDYDFLFNKEMDQSLDGYEKGTLTELSLIHI